MMKNLLILVAISLFCSQVYGGTFFSFTHGKQMESLKPKDTSPYGVTLAELQELCELIYGAQTPMEELSQLMTPVLSAKLSEVCEEKMFKRPKYN